MARIVSDKLGDYDLAGVIYITRIPQRRQISPTQTEELPPNAKLHYKGASHSTLLPFNETRDAWLALKAAEGHPGDREPTEFDRPRSVTDSLS